jgi:hypothetical protein
MNLFIKSSLVNDKDQIPGGLADHKSVSDFNQRDLVHGIKVELEHTNDPNIAMEIAKDHLTEDPLYYKKLARVEKSDTEFGGGQFRGGDPELAQQKQQEKKEEAEDLGDSGEEADEPDPADVEDQQQSDQDKADMAASLKKAELVPNGTDYAPRNKNDEPFDPLLFLGEKPSWIETAPPRRGENQHKLYSSEVLGVRTPLTNPIQHLRQYRFVDPEHNSSELNKERALLTKSVDDEDPASTDGDQKQELLTSIQHMSLPQLRQMAKHIWGDDFEYDSWATEEYIRNDVLGSVEDILEAEEDEESPTDNEDEYENRGRVDDDEGGDDEGGDDEPASGDENDDDSE